MINFKQVVGFAFPPRIYTGVAKSILTAMGIVLNGILKGFIDLHKKIDDDLSITPQVCFLEYSTTSTMIRSVVYAYKM